MKKLIAPVCIALCIIISMPYCKKGGGGSGGGSCTETAMTVTTNPASGSVQAAAPGPTFPLTVTITANLPTAGANIEVKARPESSTTAFFTETKTASGPTAFTITGTTVGVPSVVDIVITSKSSATNKVTLSYKYSRK